MHFDVISPLYLYLNFNRIYGNAEIWRLLSNFLFFDYFSLNWVFHMIFLIPNASQLEKHHFRGRTSGFVWMFVLMATMHTLLAFALFYLIYHRAMFLGPAFSFSIVYVWSRKSLHVQMNFLGLFAFQAPFLPLVILGIGTVLGQSPVQDILGICVGHLYWFFEDVYPQIRPGRHLWATPTLLKMLFDAPPAPQVHMPEAEREEPPEQMQEKEEDTEDVEEVDGKMKKD